MWMTLGFGLGAHCTLPPTPASWPASIPHNSSATLPFRALELRAWASFPLQHDGILVSRRRVRPVPPNTSPFSSSRQAVTLSSRRSARLRSPSLPLHARAAGPQGKRVKRRPSSSDSQPVPARRLWTEHLEFPRLAHALERLAPVHEASRELARRNRSFYTRSGHTHRMRLGLCSTIAPLSQPQIGSLHTSLGIAFCETHLNPLLHFLELSSFNPRASAHAHLKLL